VLRRITDEDPRPIRETNPDIPEWLCQIIGKLMSKQPDDRYESAAERPVDLISRNALASVPPPVTGANTQRLIVVFQNRIKSTGREVAGLLEKCLAHVQQPTTEPLPASLVPQSSGSRFFSTSPRSLGVVMIATIGMSLLGMVLWQAAEAPPGSAPWNRPRRRSSVSENPVPARAGEENPLAPT
jgi:serine/threonine protein kinase